MVADNAAAAPASHPSSGVPAHIAANIPPPSPMNMNGDWSANWDLFRAEFEDYALVMGLAEKTKEVQAATLRSVMGPECRHVYKETLKPFWNNCKRISNLLKTSFMIGMCSAVASRRKRNP